MSAATTHLIRAAQLRVEAGAAVTPHSHLQRRTLRQKEAKSLVSGHSASTWRNPGTGGLNAEATSFWL